jgi:hypothetical protein
VRRTKDFIQLHLADILTSAAEASIIRRCAVMSTELESLEAQFATAGAATSEQLSLYATVSNSLRRLLESGTNEANRRCRYTIS